LKPLNVALEGFAELAAVAPGILDEPLQVPVEVSSPCAEVLADILAQ
jgi:hypothetical protein